MLSRARHGSGAGLQCGCARVWTCTRAGTVESAVGAVEALLVDRLDRVLGGAVPEPALRVAPELLRHHALAHLECLPERRVPHMPHLRAGGARPRAQAVASVHAIDSLVITPCANSSNAYITNCEIRRRLLEFPDHQIVIGAVRRHRFFLHLPGKDISPVDGQRQILIWK